MPETAQPEPPHAALRDAARAWFEQLRDRLCAAFEAIEDRTRPTIRPATLRAHRLGPPDR